MKNVRRFLALAGVLTVSLVAALGRSRPDPQALGFGSDVELITVDVSIVDRTGCPTRGLTP